MFLSVALLSQYSLKYTNEYFQSGKKMPYKLIMSKDYGLCHELSKMLVNGKLESTKNVKPITWSSIPNDFYPGIFPDSFEAHVDVDRDGVSEVLFKRVHILGGYDTHILNIYSSGEDSEKELLASFNFSRGNKILTEVEPPLYIGFVSLIDVFTYKNNGKSVYLLWAREGLPVRMNQDVPWMHVDTQVFSVLNSDFKLNDVCYFQSVLNKDSYND